MSVDNNQQSFKKTNICTGRVFETFKVGIIITLRWSVSQSQVLTIPRPAQCSDHWLTGMISGPGCHWSLVTASTLASILRSSDLSTSPSPANNFTQTTVFLTFLSIITQQFCSASSAIIQFYQSMAMNDKRGITTFAINSIENNKDCFQQKNRPAASYYYYTCISILFTSGAPSVKQNKRLGR